MRAKIERNLGRQFLVVIATLVAVATVTQFSLRQEVEEQQRKARSYAVIEQADRTLSSVKDAETGQRGYLLTGKADYLVPYERAASALPREIERLATLTRDIPQRQADVGRLKALTLAMLAELKETLELRRAGDAEAALALVQTDRGSRLMAEIRDVARDIKDGENALLARRSRTAEVTHWGVSFLSWCGTSLGLYTLLFAYRQLTGELARRREAETRLLESQETLKTHIQSTRELNFELQRANTQLAERALCDELTGLKNRKAFDDDLGRSVLRARRKGEPLSVVLLGVDDFESYNEAFGRDAGDDLLRAVAATLMGSVRGGDVVGRYAGGGFLVAVHSADRSASLEAGERLRQAVARRDWPLGNVTVSVGVATLDDAATAPNVLVERADRALLRAKQQGGDQVAHSDDVPTDRAEDFAPVAHGFPDLAER